MKNKRIIFLILICFMLMLLQGCSFLQSRLRMLESELNSASEYKLEIANNVLNCFSEDDETALKALLCTKTVGLEDIDDQIQTGFDLFKGKVISFNDKFLGYEGKSTEYGRTTRLERAWSVEEIVTDSGDEYEIYISSYVIYEEDKNREGISKIIITCSDGTEYQIGYEWPSYYKEGSELSHKVVTALSENDIDGLKSMFCGKTLDIVDINEQVQNGLNFFEGKATMGKVEGKNIVYDGNHDFHTTVSDDEIVKNYEPTRTSISVFNENIETNSGKIYSMEFYAYLLYTGDESFEGISQITIISEDGTKQVIGERLD